MKRVKPLCRAVQSFKQILSLELKYLFSLSPLLIAAEC